MVNSNAHLLQWICHLLSCYLLHCTLIRLRYVDRATGIRKTPKPLSLKSSHALHIGELKMPLCSQRRPADEGKHDCIVLVAGSGPNDQDSCTTFVTCHLSKFLLRFTHLQKFDSVHHVECEKVEISDW